MKNNLNYFLLTEEYIDRKYMPQIKFKHYDIFLDRLKAENIEVKKGYINPILITPCQAINNKKVEKMIDNPRSLDKPIIIDNTYKIIDGHHRWATALELKKSVKTIRLNAPFNIIYDISKKFIEELK